MATTSVTVRMEQSLKNQAEILFEDMGLNMTTAFTIFAKAVVRQNRIPFEITGDPFWNEANQTEIQRRIEEIKSGKAKMVHKTMSELDAMANE
ncbi:MAG: type II toxin-antitoxin system RelB/DinJ family antitoxin [Oscillospiraceae bacterium]|jgi:DNA-damage-inducible protein J|nr:type II toxin-antitoxin system RelB/DinJ family antitoxin [Oscillospiraceae bacterium]